MNAFPAVPVRRGLGARRALIVLLAFEGVVALCAAVALAFTAPAAGELLGGAFGASATVAALLLAGLCAALAVGCFAATGGLLRDRTNAELTAIGVEAAVVAAAVVGFVSTGVSPELVAAAVIGGLGFLLAAIVSLRPAA